MARPDTRNTHHNAQDNASASSASAADLDDQEILLRLNYEIRNQIVHNFNEHIRALNTVLDQDLRRNLLEDNKRLIQELIDLSVIDGQPKSAIRLEYKLEFSLRNRLMANVAKNNLFIKQPNNELFNRQFKSDLLDENNLLVAFLNSLEIEQFANDAQEGMGIGFFLRYFVFITISDHC